MNNFIFQNATKVYFGKGCVKEYLACLTGKADTVLLAYGGGSIKKNGVYDEINSILRNAGKTVVEFSGIMSNPTYAKVQEGAKLAQENQADMILAVGGGSTMDCCKAVSLAARYNGDIWEDFWVRPGVIDIEPLPLGVVVTVSGTGSECNGGAVITNEEKKIKTGRDYPRLNPGFALMKSVIRNLRASIANPQDYTARSNLMWDSTMAENCLIKMGKKCDFERRNMEHQIGAYTNCNHGCGLVVIHPVYYRHIYKEGLSKFARFAGNVCGIAREGKSDEELALAGIDALADFIKEIGLPATLKELGVEKGQLKEIADSCGISQGSYKPMTHEEIQAIFRECYE